MLVWLILQEWRGGVVLASVAACGFLVSLLDAFAAPEAVPSFAEQLLPGIDLAERSWIPAVLLALTLALLWVTWRSYAGRQERFWR